MRHKVKDYYFHKAKEEEYAARSVYKLQEANTKYRFVRAGHAVLDLGCFPGSWVQYCAKVVGPRGFVLGIDRQSVTSLPGPCAHFLQADILALEPKEIQRVRESFDVVLSDMAPRTSGVKVVDHAKSMELAGKALSIASCVLKSHGSFFVKVFQGADLQEFEDEVKRAFTHVRYFKPKSSRPDSKEIFILALGRISEESCEVQIFR